MPVRSYIVSGLHTDNRPQQSGRLTHIRIWSVFGLDKNCPLRNRQRSVHPGLGSRPMMRAQSRPATSL
jgi:hypothetical protein